MPQPAGASYDVLATLPTPPGGVIASGDTWHLQCWYLGAMQLLAHDVCFTLNEPLGAR